MARFPSGALVAGVVSAALAVVSAFALVAAGAPQRDPYASVRAVRAGHAGSHPRDGLPASGAGSRVVYSVERHKVWLVDDTEQVVASYRVAAGTVPPSVGTHRVFARAARGKGGDGVAVEHIVLFAAAGDVNIGFSAAVDGPLARPAPGLKSTGIREARPDGDAMWRFATIGTVVEVIP